MSTFYRFNVPTPDIPRNYLPDIIVLVLSIFSGIFLLLVHIAEKKSHQRQAKTVSAAYQFTSCSNDNSSNLNLTVEDNISLISSRVHRLELSELSVTETLSPKMMVQEFEAKVSVKQQKRTSFALVKLLIRFLLSVLWKLLYITFLWFSGVCVACVLNFVYFVSFIYLALGWALHLNQTKIFNITRKVLTVIVSLYSAVHLILLYLYQFHSAQEHVPQSSITAR